MKANLYMTKKEIELYEKETNEAISIVENLLKVEYWYFDNYLKKYRFKFPNDKTVETIDLPRTALLYISK